MTRAFSAGQQTAGFNGFGFRWNTMNGWGRIFAVLFGLLLLTPIVPILYQAFLSKPLYDGTGDLTLDNFARLASDPDFVPAVLNTIYFAGLSTIIALVLGFVFSVVIERFEIPFRRTLRFLIIAPIFISPLIMALAWSMVYGSGGYVSIMTKVYFGANLPNLNSLTGMCIVTGIVQVPITYLYLSSAAANIPNVFERSAIASGASWLTAVRTILLPLLRPAILFCVLLNIMLVIDQLAVPLIIGEPARVLVLATFLYTKGAISVQMDYGIIAAAAVCMILVIQALIVLQGRLVGESRKYVTVGGKGQGMSRRAPSCVSAGIISAVLAIYAIITLIVPTLFLILRSFTSVLTPLIPISQALTLENYAEIFGFEQYVRSIYNSLLISVFGGVAAVAITFLAALFAYRTTPGVRTAIEQIATIPRAIPGLIVGLGFFYGVILFPGGEYLKNTLFILFLAFFIRNFPTGFGAVAPSFLQVGEELDRAARACGASRWVAIKDVTLPLTKRALAGSFVLYFVYFVKEYSSAAFLFGPGSEVIGTTMLQLNFSGFLGTLAALACVELVILVPFAILIYGRR